MPPFGNWFSRPKDLVEDNITYGGSTIAPMPPRAPEAKSAKKRKLEATSLPSNKLRNSPSIRPGFDPTPFPDVTLVNSRRDNSAALRLYGHVASHSPPRYKTISEDRSIDERKILLTAISFKKQPCLAPVVAEDISRQVPPVRLPPPSVRSPIKKPLPLPSAWLVEAVEIPRSQYRGHQTQATTEYAAVNPGAEGSISVHRGPEKFMHKNLPGTRYNHSSPTQFRTTQQRRELQNQMQYRQGLQEAESTKTAAANIYDDSTNQQLYLQYYQNMILAEALKYGDNVQPIPSTIKQQLQTNAQKQAIIMMQQRHKAAQHQRLIQQNTVLIQQQQARNNFNNIDITQNAQAKQMQEMQIQNAQQEMAPAHYQHLMALMQRMKNPQGQGQWQQ